MPPTVIRWVRAYRSSCPSGNPAITNRSREQLVTTHHLTNRSEANTMLETVISSRAMVFNPQLAEPSPKLHLLIVDSDPAMRSACAQIAESLGYLVESTGELGHARSILCIQPADIMLVSLPRNSNEGLALISEIRLLYPQLTVVAMTASGSVNVAVEAMRCGASDYLSKPFNMDEVSTVLDRASANHSVLATARQLREQLRLSHGLGAMIGHSVEMEKL